MAFVNRAGGQPTELLPTSPAPQAQPVTPGKERAVWRDRWRRAARFIGTPLLTVLVASFAVFVGLTVTSGDPVASLLPPRATDAQRAALRAELGLDQSILVRYWNWLSDSIHGDFGLSTVYRLPVSELIGARLGTTLFLVVYAAILVLVFGLITGVAATVYRRLRSVSIILNGTLIAIPVFVAAFLLIAVFAVNLGWFPTSGTGEGFIDQLWHMTLPAVALSLGWGAYLSQLTRTSLEDEQRGEHVAAARGRGVPSRTVFRRHVVRNAAGPVITVAGTIVAFLITGAVVVEATFGIDGVGTFLVKSVASKDTNVVLAINALLVLLFVLTTTIVEACQRLLDPRVRDGGAR